MDKKWIFLIFALIIVAVGFCYYAYENTVNLEFENFHCEKSIGVVENSNDNSKDARALFVYLNQINSKDTGKEISGNCTAFDEHNNIIFSRDIMRVDYSGECIFEFDYISEDIFNNINRIEIAFYDNGNLLYQNSTTDIHIHNYTISDSSNHNTPTKSTSSGTKYVASSNSGKFHTPGCEWAGKISSKNKVVFDSFKNFVDFQNPFCDCHSK